MSGNGATAMKNYCVIIALEDDQRIRRALAVTPNIEFFRYQISFKLIKV
jgi:restriction system protein